MAGGGAEAEERVVVDLHVPEGRGGVALHSGEFAEEPAGEIDEMDALIDEFAAAGKDGIGAPLAVVALASPVAVAGAEKHERAEDAGTEEFAGFLEGGMEAMIVAEADASVGQLSGGENGAELGGVERAGFLEEHVFAVADGGEGDGSERRVEGGDDDGGDARVSEGDGVVGDGRATRGELGEVGCAGEVEIAGVEQRGIFAEGKDALAADETAADDGEIKLLEFCVGHSVRRMIKATLTGRGTQVRFEGILGSPGTAALVS